MATASEPGVSFHNLSAGGATGDLIRAKDWSATTLGPRDAWSRSLRNHLSMIFELPTAAIIFWGRDQIQLYNDGYAVIMGPRHPQHLGSTFRECWPEAYDTIHPWMERVLDDGETIAVNQTLIPLARFGFTDEAYFTFSFSPLRDDTGAIAGVLQLVTEVTQTVLAERRAAALRDLSNQTPRAETPHDAARLTAEVLARCSADLPCSFIYLADIIDRHRMTLAASTGLPLAHVPLPLQVDLLTNTDPRLTEIAQAVREQRLIVIEDVESHFGTLPGGAWPEPPRLAFAAPIVMADRSVGAVLVGALSPRLAFDTQYQGFVQLVSAQIATLVSAARANDDERKRAEAVAAIDRAKTEFFSNVSHEFRTPLTLILGPLEDALHDGSRLLEKDVFDAVHRNAIRLLRLVNTLLDFARLEADRLTPTFEPTDLAAFTAGLAGSFQSLVESAGLKLRVDCPPLPQPIYVDQSQWEKIVLNLISNAFKFTFEGEIAVRLHESDGVVHLTVSDTGAGIPAEELPRIFERFHRVKGARGRSYEGTGIGLALVQALAKQHGGTVAVGSVVGKGTSFTVSIPKRTNPPMGQPGTEEHGARPSGTAPHLLEAARWIPNSVGEAAAASGAGITTPGAPPRAPDSPAHILIVDDNADMRQHLARLLSPHWSIETAADGQAALEAVAERRPDLVLSDIMMPRMDGVALVGALRKDSATATIPIVLLSARAGEDAVVGGFDTGADDYLVKPFAARELLARVRSHLEMTRLRREWASELERTNRELEAFSYSVSHDLRTPLRAIDGFSKALLEQYADRLDDEGRRYLERVRTGTRRMSQLIDDLLSLSRITRTQLRREAVNLSAMARDVLSDLQDNEPSRAVEVVVADALTIDADRKLVAILLENLLSNAWKFTARRSGARVEVGSISRPSERAFFVRDNGAGFNMAYAAKLFTPFQRLHSQAEFDGTGIGLATVQRVVARHGGRVWAESAVDQGATFFFTFSGAS